MKNKTVVKSLFYHLVLVTKYRRKCITAPMLARLKTHCEVLVEKWQSELLEFNGEPDRVHLLISLNPKVTPSAFVNNLKTVTCRYIREEIGEELKRYYWNKPVSRSRSYCIISCGGAPLSVVQQYIEQQEKSVKPQETTIMASGRHTG